VEKAFPSVPRRGLALSEPQTSSTIAAARVGPAKQVVRQSRASIAKFILLRLYHAFLDTPASPSWSTADNVPVSVTLAEMRQGRWPHGPIGSSISCVIILT
jgi:hypothetical protein